MAAEAIKLPECEAGESLFLTGYFNDRIRAGEKPDYGYAQNHLPSVAGHKMKVVTGFFSSLKAK